MIDAQTGVGMQNNQSLLKRHQQQYYQTTNTRNTSGLKQRGQTMPHLTTYTASDHNSISPKNCLEAATSSNPSHSRLAGNSGQNITTCSKRFTCIDKESGAIAMARVNG
jgi:hypothetical protein